jgi:hypothetical protein
LVGDDLQLAGPAHGMEFERFLRGDGWAGRGFSWRMIVMAEAFCP